MIEFLFGSMKASSFQSVAQLSVAVSLAYVVAGPEVSRLLRTKFAGFDQLSQSLAAIQAVGTGINIPPRQALLDNARKLIERESMQTAPANPATTYFYIGAAAASFVTLLYCTFFEDLSVIVALALVASALVVLLRDPWVAASQAKKLQLLMDEVFRIARTHNPRAPNPSSITSAAAVIAELELQIITLHEGHRRLKAL